MLSITDCQETKAKSKDGPCLKCLIGEVFVLVTVKVELSSIESTVKNFSRPLDAMRKTLSYRFARVMQCAFGVGYLRATSWTVVRNATSA